MSASDKAYRDLAAMVVEMQKRLDGLSTSQLAHSSLENTGLPTYDDTGQIMGQIGRLPDGSYGSVTLSGPPPPIPSAPKARAIRGVGLEIEWDGLFQDAQAVVPLEGGRLEVYVHESTDITPALVPTYTLESPRGGKFLISVGYDQTHYVAFAFRASSGKVSAASAVVGPCTVPRVTQEDLDVNFDALRGTRIFYGPDEPVTDKADLWLRDNPDGTQTALRYDPDTDVWIELQDQGIAEALAKAAEANEAATQAGIDALAAQQTADGKTTIYRQASAPAGAALGSYWIDSDDNVPYRWEGATPSWVKVQDANITIALQNAATAQSTADGKMRIFPQASAPYEGYMSPSDEGDMWIDTDDSNTVYTWASNGTTWSWTPRRIGNGAIVPQSLVASNVIATGTVTAALFEALLVLTTEVIAGDVTGSHARMTPQGFRVYRADLSGDGVPDEVVRMGTDTNDYFGIVDAAGDLVASIDDTGRVSGSEGNFEALNVAGKSVVQMIEDGPRGVVAHFRKNLDADLGPIFYEVGVAELGGVVHKGRAYKFSWRLQAWAQNNDGQFIANLHYTVGAAGDTTTQPAAPMVTSPTLAGWEHFTVPGADRRTTYGGSTIINAGDTTRIRLGLGVAIGGLSALTNIWVFKNDIEFILEDIGPSIPLSGTVTQMGGALNNGQTAPPPPAPVQQYFVDLEPAGRASWRGDGGQITWINSNAPGDVYQGYESYNGNTRGQFWFNLPSITGTVDRVDFWAYFRHWWYNSGGTVRMGITDQRGEFTDHSFRGLWETGGWPKPGGKEVLLPSDWWPLFKGTDNFAYNGRGTCITLGPGVGTNQLYYGVATDARLRIYYTQ